MNTNSISTSNRIAGDYIEQRVRSYMNHRFEDSLLREAEPRLIVKANYDPIKMLYIIVIQTYNGFELSMLVDEDVIMEFNQSDDWLMYHLQRVEPMVDTLVFTEWLYHKFESVDKAEFRKHIYRTINRVSFTPPRGLMQRAEGKVSSKYLVNVAFNNGQVWREIMSKIGDEPNTFFAMLLMVDKS